VRRLLPGDAGPGLAIGERLQEHSFRLVMGRGPADLERTAREPCTERHDEFLRMTFVRCVPRLSGIALSTEAHSIEQLRHALVHGAVGRALAAVQPLLDATAHGRRV
jgi:hypothetical protein